MATLWASVGNDSILVQQAKGKGKKKKSGKAGKAGELRISGEDDWLDSSSDGGGSSDDGGADGDGDGDDEEGRKARKKSKLKKGQSCSYWETSNSIDVTFRLRSESNTRTSFMRYMMLLSISLSVLRFSSNEQTIATVLRTKSNKI